MHTFEGSFGWTKTCEVNRCRQRVPIRSVDDSITERITTNTTSAFSVAPVLWRCWLGGRKGIRPVKKQSDGVLAWLSVMSEVQTCIWPSWCRCHSLSLASVKCRLVLPLWYRLTRASAGFWLGGSMPPCRLRRRKFWKFDYEVMHSEVYLNKCVVSRAPFSTPACPDCSQNIT